jgi:hypothetical protein
MPCVEEREQVAIRVCLQKCDDPPRIAVHADSVIKLGRMRRRVRALRAQVRFAVAGEHAAPAVLLVIAGRHHYDA